MYMKKHKNILLTFDYELGLGRRSGTVDNCIINPTREIQRVLNKNNCKAIFFIDTTYLMRMEESFHVSEKIVSDYNKIKKQIISLSNDGHYIYHHIHPHWVDAKYIMESNEWDLSNTSNYSLSSLGFVKKKELFFQSKKILGKILSEAVIKKPILGYRAGGLFVQPFKDLIPIFNEINIKYDFSVLKGASCKNKDLCFNYETTPKKTVYSFSDNVTVEDRTGKFVEVSMEQIQIKNLNKIFNGLHFRLIYKGNRSYKSFGDGVSTNNKIESKASSFLVVKETISLELLNPIRYRLYLDFIKNKKFTHFISHPKLLSLKSLLYFDKMLEYLRFNYDVTTDFDEIINTKHS